MNNNYGANRHITTEADFWSSWFLNETGDTLHCVEIKSHDIDGNVKNEWAEWWPLNNTPEVTEFFTRSNREVIRLKLFNSNKAAVTASEAAHNK